MFRFYYVKSIFRNRGERGGKRNFSVSLLSFMKSIKGNVWLKFYYVKSFLKYRGDVSFWFYEVKLKFNIWGERRKTKFSALSARRVKCVAFYPFLNLVWKWCFSFCFHVVSYNGHLHASGIYMPRVKHSPFNMKNIVFNIGSL